MVQVISFVEQLVLRLVVHNIGIMMMVENVELIPVVQVLVLLKFSRYI